ncbi:MAG TPA: hypothetical protein VEK82_14830 [Stellaceae bacterium]|nr:hypothetical protein [Stellaceae bacterium]
MARPAQARPVAAVKGGYTPALAGKICDRIAEGDSLATIATLPGMPSRRTVRGWLEEHPEFDRQYEIARRQRTDNLVDEAISIADSVTGSDSNAEVAAARLAVDTRRWLASKLLPERYGDKIGVAVEGVPLIPEPPNHTKLAMILLNILHEAAEEPIAAATATPRLLPPSTTPQVRR